MMVMMMMRIETKADGESLERDYCLLLFAQQRLSTRSLFSVSNAL